MKEEEEDEEEGVKGRGGGSTIPTKSGKNCGRQAGTNTLGAILFFFRSGGTSNQPAKRAQQLKQRGRERGEI